MSILLVLTGFAGLLVIATGARSHQPPAGVQNVDFEHEVKRRTQHARPEAFRLENGLQVIAIPFPASKTATIMIWYKVGSADDPPDKPGLAHFVEHATFGAMGAHDRPGRRARHRVSDVEPEAFTSFDYTAYYVTVPPDGVELATQVEAARLSRLVIDRKAVEAERDAVIEEWTDGIEADPEVLLEEYVRALLWDATPYGHPVVSDSEKTNRISVQDIRDFYDTWYAPNNALLIASGRVDPHELLELAERYFGKIPRRPIPRRYRPRPMLPENRGRVVLHDLNAYETFWTRAYIAPSFAKTDGGIVAATAVLAEYLADDPAGLFHRDLAEEQNFVKHIGVDFLGEAIGYGTLTIHAVLNPGIDVLEFERALERSLTKLASGVVSQRELERARSKVRRAISEAWNDPFAAANAVGGALATGRSIQEVMAWDENVAATTADRVKDAAAQLFTNRNSVSGILRPK